MTERLTYLCKVRDALKQLVELDFDTDYMGDQLAVIEEAIEYETTHDISNSQTN